MYKFWITLPFPKMHSEHRRLKWTWMNFGSKHLWARRRIPSDFFDQKLYKLHYWQRLEMNWKDLRRVSCATSPAGKVEPLDLKSWMMSDIVERENRIWYRSHSIDPLHRFSLEELFLTRKLGDLNACFS